MDRSRNGRTTPTRSGATPTEGRAKQRAYLIAALDEGDDLSELRELLSTAGVAVVGQAVQHRDKPHPNTYLGPGKLIEVKAAAKEADANVIVCDDELSPRQERNLEKELGMSVVLAAEVSITPGSFDPPLLTVAQAGGGLLLLSRKSEGKLALLLITELSAERRRLLLGAHHSGPALLELAERPDDALQYLLKAHHLLRA